MKRLATLVLALCLTLGAASQASAIEVVPSGVMDFVFAYDNGTSFMDTEQDHFSASQRSRIQVDFIANENLRGVLMLQFGKYNWGGDGQNDQVGAGALDTTKGSPWVRRLFIDFNFPDSPVNMKMGLMDLVLPNATFGQPVLGNHVAAVTMTANVTDNAALTAFWARPLRGDSSTKDNDMDVFGVWANLDFESFTLAPWVAYASIGSNSNFFDREYGIDTLDLVSDTANWWGLGLALKAMPTDSLTIKFDAMYAKLSDDIEYNGPLGADEIEASGYYFALAVDYAMDWGTPGFFAIYSSGDDDDDDYKIGRMPVLGHDDGVYATRMGFGGSMTCGTDTLISQSGVGMWMVGLQLADLSFIENVTHVARVAYFQGTNDEDSNLIRYNQGNNLASLPLSKKDNGWEVNFDTTWQMYENLTVQLELGYIYLDIDDNYAREDRWDESNAYNANLIFRFGF